jgi:predicted O-methyltransferase YrrM
MPLIPVMPLNGEELLEPGQIDCSYPISAEQLKNAKIVPSREDYIYSLSKNIRYMEVGVAWGYYSLMIADRLFPSSITLVDWFNQDLKCWSWRKFGECKCTPKHELKYDQDNHMEYIKDQFSKFKNVELIKGNSEEILPKLNKEFDYIYLDITNDRKPIRQTLNAAAKLTAINGIIGLNDYLIYDGIIEDKPYATYQVVNEFLMLNKNWEVDALALHVLGFYDIYIKRVS